MACSSVVLITTTVCVLISTVWYSIWREFPITDIIGFSQTAYDVDNRSPSDVHLQWFAPKHTAINNLSATLDTTGVFGFIFNSSDTPTSVPYGTYNWCNMPHVRSQEYVKAPVEYKLEYVEVVRKTPYKSNTFPHEVDAWNCDDEALFYYGTPEPEGHAAAINWQMYTSTSNPLELKGFKGSCQFPQITAGGLLDSRRHGSDLFGVYHDLLHFLPDDLDRSRMSFRVTNNQITSQVAGQVIFGMYPASNHMKTPVLVQPPSVDSLEPGYACPAASRLSVTHGVSSTKKAWLRHLRDRRTKSLFSRLDLVSGVSVSDSDWHVWFDHYFDNLSSRLCHQKPLPCKTDNSSLCVTQGDAEAVFRMGQYEYSYIYRDRPELFDASVAAYGIWMAELATNLRNVMARKDDLIYRHNFAHDGSISRLLSILQVDVMVWPGMGSEVVFELYSSEGKWYLRVLWSGQVLQSSNPSLGQMNLLPVEVFLAYIDGLVGVGAKKIPHLCEIPH